MDMRQMTGGAMTPEERLRIVRALSGAAVTPEELDPRMLLQRLQAGGLDADKLEHRLMQGSVPYNREGGIGADDLPQDFESSMFGVMPSNLRRRYR